MQSIIKLEDHPVILFACEELVAASMRAGLQWKVIEANKQIDDKSVIVGTWATLKSKGWFPSTLKFGVDHYLFGESDGHIWISGQSERATLYAVYHFCKVYWGEQWIYPAELTLSEPTNTSLHIVSYEPAFIRRGFVFETINEPDYIISMIDWLVKNRINEVFFTFTLWDELKDRIAPEISKRGLSVTLGGHSMKFFLDKETALNQSVANHPYTAIKQLNYQDKVWQEKIYEEIVAYCQDVPNLTRISLWPEDVAIEPDSEQTNSFLKSYIEYTEGLKATLIRKGIDITVEHIAYNAGLSWMMLERDGMEISQEVDSLFAYWGRDYRYSFLESPQKSDQRACISLKDWIKGTKKSNRELTIFEYYSDQFMLTPLFPLLSQRITADLKEYNQLGIEGITNLIVPVRTIENHPWHWIHQFNSYVFCRACWGDQLEDILEDYYLYFQDKERAWIRCAFELVEEILPAITTWNTLLFPARIVDPEMAKGNKKQSLDAYALLEEISKNMQRLLQQSPLSEDNMANKYIEHLANYSHEMAKQWNDKKE
ncbi:hypothetical protein [Bacillus sp. FSL K6-3431]|uniref:hypothetical protein n=1 Tax=Bacillus sp. FSL K6-3431 TaxID=2921500 RepID=UPI0030FC5765